MTTTTHEPPAPAPKRHAPPAPVRAAAIVVGLTVVIALIAVAFALPAAKSQPRDVPIGTAGPRAELIADQLSQNARDAFDITTYPDEAAMRDAIRNRDIYGGIALTPTGPTLLIATGASPAVAQLLTQVGDTVAQKTGAPLKKEDLAPPTADDPRGTGLAASALPITLAGLVPAIALVLALRGAIWTGLTAVVAASALIAVTVTAIMRYVLGSIDHDFWLVAGGLTLGVLAMGLAMYGLGSLFGKAGLAAGAATAILLGNPLSGLTSAPEMLPRGWGTFGQFLPQGANATLLRSTAYFDGAGAMTAIAVLACWAVAGTVLVVVAARRRGA